MVMTNSTGVSRYGEGRSVNLDNSERSKKIPNSFIDIYRNKINEQFTSTIKSTSIGNSNFWHLLLKFLLNQTAFRFRHKNEYRITRIGNFGIFEYAQQQQPRISKQNE